MNKSKKLYNIIDKYTASWIIMPSQLVKAHS